MKSRKKGETPKSEPKNAKLFLTVPEAMLKRAEAIRPNFTSRNACFLHLILMGLEVEERRIPR